MGNTDRPPPNEVDRRLLALPARLGGLGVSMLSSTSDDNFVASMSVTAPLRQLIHHQDDQYSYETSSDQMSAKADIQRRRREQAITNANHLRNELTPTLQRAMDLARERGSSSWLTARPLEEHGFSLHKGAFVEICGPPPKHPAAVRVEPTSLLSTCSPAHGAASPQSAIMRSGTLPPPS